MNAPLTLPPGRGLALIALAATAILYGSLYPFRTQALPPGLGLLEALRAAALLPPGSRGDLLANLLLYVPLGGSVVAAMRGGAAARLAAAGLGSLLLSGAVEVAQVFVEGRSSSIWDLGLNTLGGGLGGVAALFGLARLRAPTGFAPSPSLAQQPFALVLLLCWLGYRLYPYVPSLDLQEWRTSLKPLLTPMLEPVRTLRLAVGWMVAAQLLEAVAGRRRGLLLVPAMLLGALAAEVVIVDNDLTPAEVLGAGLALAGWLLLRALPPATAGKIVPGALLLALLVALVVDRLEPFRFDQAAGRFEWIPFRSLLAGHWGNGLQAMLQKFFLYGSSLWLAVRLRVPLPAATLVLALLLGATSLAQTWIPGRSAEVTDVLLAIVAAVILALLEGGRPTLAAAPMAARGAPQSAWRARRERGLS